MSAISCKAKRAIGVGDLRHQSGGQNLEEEGECYSHASHITAETRAERQETGEESDDGKEESNDEECKHEAGKVIVVVRTSVTPSDQSLVQGRRAYPRNPAGMLATVPKFCGGLKGRAATVCLQFSVVLPAYPQRARKVHAEVAGALPRPFVAARKK